MSFVVFGPLACALAPLPAPAADDGGPAAPEEELGGAALFEQRCASCHGSDGGGSEIGPQIKSPVVGYAAYVVRHGRDDMPFADAMPVFDEASLATAELDRILEHLRSFPKPEDGRGLYERYCGNCHGEGARGGRVEKDLTEEAQEEPEDLLEKVREGEGGTSYGEREEYMPAWAKDELSDADVAAIVAYVQGLPREGDEDEDSGD